MLAVVAATLALVLVAVLVTMLVAATIALVATAATLNAPRCVIIGGTGRIGTSVATHLLSRCPSMNVVLAGRSPERGAAAVTEVGAQANVEFLELDFRDATALRAALDGAAAVVHTAGPYAGEAPDVLRAALEAKVPVYTDLSDPIDYLDAAVAMSDAASDTLALCAAGAFPGLSNVFAMEAAARLGEETIEDIDFSYFTAGLGGAGEVNLYITNDGFGEPVPVYRNGKYDPQLESGGNTRRVPFFLSGADAASQQLVGERDVWSWPFPEGTLVARELGITGSSSVGMGTAPGVWNDVMGLMVKAIPRPWWKTRAFSNGLAKFSRPLVYATDLFVGETHAMRIDIKGKSGGRIAAVQTHESFRGVVGQSCAEFTLALLCARGLVDATAEEADALSALPARGVFTPEALFRESAPRAAVLARLLTVPGTTSAGYQRDDGQGGTVLETLRVVP